MKRILLPCVLVAFAANVRADETTDLIKKAVEAHGGEAALKKAKAGEFAMAGDMSVLGANLKYKATVAYLFPDKYTMTIDTELMGMKLVIAQVVNGDKMKSSLNGMSQKLGDAEKAELKAALNTQEMTFVYPLLDAKRFTVKAEKDTKVGDDEAWGISVTPKDGKEVKLYYDKKTNLLVKMSRKGMPPGGGGEVDEVTVFTDYKKVDGIMTPMGMKVTHDGEKFMTGKVSDAKYLDKIDEKKFKTDE
jgi:hypothetical protein